MTIELIALAAMAMAMVPHVAQVPQAVTNWFYVSFAPSPDSNVVGYKVYIFTNSGMYQQVVDVGNQTADNLIETTVPFPINAAVRSYDADGNESDFTGVQYWNGAYETDITNAYRFWTADFLDNLEGSSDLLHWSNLGTNSLTLTNPPTGFLRDADDPVSGSNILETQLFHASKWVPYP